MTSIGATTEAVDVAPTRLLARVRLAALILGGAFTWAARHGNNPAGISYLDIADAYMRGDLASAINGYWSPLYSLVLGFALAIVKPDPFYEATIAHVVNFLIYGGAMIAFDALLRAVIRRAEANGDRSIPRWAWIVFGYAAFTWSSLVLINVSDLSADLLMAAFVYGAAVLLVRWQSAPLSLAGGASFGVLLGLGYLSKAAMFPLSFVFFATALASRGEWRRNVPSVAAAVFAFALVSSPFVVALSAQKGRLTTGDVGKLVYAWFVNDVTKYAHWQGEPPGRGVPVHPDRQIHDRPAVFEYATPIIATHAVWYDPSYWYEGLQTHIDPAKQVRALLVAVNVYWALAIQAAAPLLALGVLLSLRASDDVWRRIGRQWFLLVPGLVPFAMFAILHTETRFVGAFLMLVFLGLMLAVGLPNRVDSPRLVSTLMIAASAVLAADTLVAAARRIQTDNGRHVDYEIAAGLSSMGIRAGDQVGTIGWAFDSYWARLAKIRIVAEMPQPDVLTFWSETPERRNAVYDAFRRANVRLLVTDWIPPTSAADGWQRVGDGSRFAYWLEGGADRN